MRADQASARAQHIVACAGALLVFSIDSIAAPAAQRDALNLDALALQGADFRRMKLG